MIIKIDIDDGIDADDAISHSRMLMDLHRGWGEMKFISHYHGLSANITHKSKAGNIFIHVSKVDV